MSSPLEDIRVIDLSRILAGPWASQLLADLGADVIKVERPGGGDETRHWGPPFRRDPESGVTADAAYYFAANRGKRSIALDISKDEGQQVIRRLVADADVVIENFRVGALAKYGLDFESLAAINPRIIYCSISGFGQDGPYRDRAGYDFLIQGMGGLMSITGEPGGRPLKTGVAISDISTGVYAALAIVAALFEREKSGKGQAIDMSLLDVQVSWLANQNMNYLIGGRVPAPSGNAHPNIVPYQDFATRDGRIIIAVGSEAQFRKLAGVLGAPELADDERFKRNADRVANRDALVSRLEQCLSEMDSDHWLDRLDEAGIPAGPINSIADVFADPQVRARGLRFDLPDRDARPVPQVKTPIRYSRSEMTYDRAPPALGEDGDEVLAEAGYSAEEIAGLRKRGIVG